jgi:hypothetical protein
MDFLWRGDSGTYWNASRKEGKKNKGKL